jgi:hypothetical protein
VVRPVGGAGLLTVPQTPALSNHFSAPDPYLPLARPHFVCTIQTLHTHTTMSDDPRPHPMRVHYMHNVCTITPNPVLLVARNCAHYMQSDARGEDLIFHYSA